MLYKEVAYVSAYLIFVCHSYPTGFIKHCPPSLYGNSIIHSEILQILLKANLATNTISLVCVLKESAGVKFIS